jgi:hypothetical protein
MALNQSNNKTKSEIATCTLFWSQWVNIVTETVLWCLWYQCNARSSSVTQYYTMHQAVWPANSTFTNSSHKSHWHNFWWKCTDRNSKIQYSELLIKLFCKMIYPAWQSKLQLLVRFEKVLHKFVFVPQAQAPHTLLKISAAVVWPSISLFLIIARLSK